MSDQLTTGDSKTCPECAESVMPDAKVCRFCGHRFLDQTAPPSSPKSVGGAVVLGALLSGLGHFYVGENGRGGVLIAALVVSFIGIANAATPPGPIMIPIVVGIVSMVDAYRGAKGYNAGLPLRKPTGGLYALIALGVVGIILEP